MNNIRSLFVGMVSSATILLTPSHISIALAQLAPEEINAIAKPFTVRIDGANEGSGAIIDKSDDVYTVVTNWHVVRVVGTYTVQTVDGQEHSVDYSQTKEFPDSTDLAIIKFTSENDYDVANLGESEDLGEGQTIHLAGYPAKDQIAGERGRNYRFENLNLVSILSERREGGYTLSYGGENFSGMSGSPILDSNGDIVGINGTSFVDIDGKARSNYAIPINTYKDLVTAAIPQEDKTNLLQDTVATSGNLSSADSLIKKKLDPVPVFTIADEEGAPLVREVDGEGKVSGVFISQQDAEDVIAQIKSDNPELADKVKVVPVSLGEIHRLQESSESKDNKLKFLYQPKEASVNNAKNISSINGNEYSGGVPLFVAKGGEDKGYLTIDKDGQQVIPFFFELSQLENLIEKFEEQKPELAQNTTIEVVPLEGVIETLETSKDENFEKVVLVPSSESIQFLQSSR